MQSGKQGFTGTSSSGPTEQDVKRGTQRATGRYEVGYAIGIVGFILGLIIGAATGSWVIGIGLALAALIGGVLFQYS